MKNTMKLKSKNKKSQSSVKLDDLKPKKDPKGGIPPGPCGPRGAHVRSTVSCVQ
jgi:hypothetical protein